MTHTQLLLGTLSDNAIRSATVVMVLSMLGYAAQWAFVRERTSLESARRRQRRTAVPADQRAESANAELANAELANAESANAELANAELVGAAAGAGGSADPLVAATADRLGADDRVDTVDRLAASAASAPAASAGPGDAAAGARRGAAAADRFGRIGFNLFVLGAVVLMAGVLLRGLAAGRVPWSNMYEFATSASAVVSLSYLVLRTKLRIQWLTFPLVCFLLVILGLATTVLYEPVGGLIPALQSYWLAIHVTAAVLSTSLFTVGAIVSAMQLFKARAQRRGTGDSGYLGKLPSASKIDSVAYRINAFSFPIWTFALMAGSIWAQHAWGRFWNWDPKETWMFISWVCYAAYLHARATPGWRARLPWICLVAYGTVLFNLVGVNVFITGLHSYAGI